MEEINDKFIKSIPKQAFFLISERCKNKASDFREVHDDDMNISIKGILTGRSGEKYTITIYKNLMVVEFGITSVTFNDYDDKDKPIEKLFYHMKKSIITNISSIEKATIEEIIKDFC